MFRFFLLACVMAAPIASADPNNQIPFKRSVELAVGQSMVVHGYRGDCGKRPENVDPDRTRATKLGVLSNGKWGMTKSRRCGGWTPAIEVIFTATQKGQETIKVAGESIEVRVR